MFIGVCGPSGAGKDTVANILAERLGYVHVSGGDILREMLGAAGLEPKKSAIGSFGVFIRENYGADYLFEKVLSKGKGAKGVIVSGIRTPDEATMVKTHGGRILFVEAESKARFDRIISRSRSSDTVSREDFDRLEVHEHSGVKGTEMNLHTVRGLADNIIVNDGTIEQLKERLNTLALQ